VGAARRPLAGRPPARDARRARALIADAHSDLLLELVHRRLEERPFERHWLEPLQRGGVGLQVCAVYVGVEDIPEAALRRAIEATAAFNRAVRECDRVVRVGSRADLDGLGDQIGLVLSLEGCEPLGADPESIDVFWELGVRMVSLTWNRRNAFADGCTEPPGGGLSAAGGQLVDRLVELGIAIDLAHASERTFDDVLARCGDAPVLVSHAGCRAVHDIPRNLSDDQLAALAERDGVLGVMLIPFAVGDDSLDRAIDHVEHAAAVMGDRGVALGGDFIRQVHDATGGGRPDPTLPPGVLGQALEGLAGPGDYGAFVEALRRRGWEGERLDGLLHGNLLRVLRRALPAA
jgi:membrane dipeptidase